LTAQQPVGAVLAGGRGRRIGGDKATVELDGRPLIAYPVAALAAVLAEVVVVAREETVLPELTGVGAVWIEPAGPGHPLAGIVHALRAAGGRAVLACAADLPLVGPELVRLVAESDPGGAPAVVPRAGGRLQPLFALYTPLALAGLATWEADAPATEAVLALDPRILDVEDEEAFLNVNAPEDLLSASAILARRRAVGGDQPNVNA
jgi:molybdopterin-guanine dinucleotide biosynthesis protein A